MASIQAGWKGRTLYAIIDSTMAITSISSALTAARTEAGLSQRQLAAKAGTAQSLVARIERGQANPTMDTITRLVDAAGFDLEITVVPKPASDPIVELLKRDVDRSLLRENLKKTPQQRMRTLQAMAELVEETRRARAKRSAKRATKSVTKRGAKR